MWREEEAGQPDPVAVGMMRAVSLALLVAGRALGDDDWKHCGCPTGEYCPPLVAPPNGNCGWLGAQGWACGPQDAPQSMCKPEPTESESKGSLFGIAGLALPNGAMDAGKFAIGRVAAGSDPLAFESASLVEGVHILDAMSSGAGLAVEGRTAFLVGYTCHDTQQYTTCYKSTKTMSLFAVDVETGTVELNASTPFPFWEDLDDHHVALRKRGDGALVIAGILDVSNDPRPLVGGVAVMTSTGHLVEKHVVDQKFGDYIKGPMALDDDASVVYLATASLGAAAQPIIRYDLESRTQTNVFLPGSLVAMSMDFDATRGGLWVLASNATKILEDGYWLVFLPRGAETNATVSSLGRGCLSLENPGDNWSSMSSFDASTGLFVVAASCQPSPSQISSHLLHIDVATATIERSPLVYSGSFLDLGNVTGQIFGIAAA